MLVNHRGFELEAKREMSLGGWVNLYYSVVRVSDGWVMQEGIGGEGERVRDMIGYLKANVDDYYEHPEHWEGD